MDLQKYILDYRIATIGEKDIDFFYDLCASNPMYYQYLNEPLSKEKLKSSIKAVPANAEHNNKFYYGFWNNKNLVAVLELILFYPDGQTAMIGFFMVHNDFQGSGVGSKIIQSLLQYLRELHFEYAVLSYVSGNEQSHSFWLKNGFCDTEDEDIFEDISLRVMELRL